jgi:hypothetical protein
MSGKPYKDWEEVKKDIKKWHDINIGCIFFAVLCVIGGAAAETLSGPLGIDFSMTPTSFFLLAIFLAVLSIAPHMSVVALKSWFGIESERKNK